MSSCPKIELKVETEPFIFRRIFVEKTCFDNTQDVASVVSDILKALDIPNDGTYTLYRESTRVERANHYKAISPKGIKNLKDITRRAFLKNEKPRFKFQLRKARSLDSRFYVDPFGAIHSAPASSPAPQTGLPKAGPVDGTPIQEMISLLASEVKQMGGKLSQFEPLNDQLQDSNERINNLTMAVAALTSKLEALPLAAKKTSSVIHFHILCDGPNCVNKSTPIEGVRYKCSICPDVDFCSSCEALDTHQIDHPLLKIKKPLDKLTITAFHEPCPLPQSRVLHPLVRCDNCSKTIQGTRYLCATCEDFDLDTFMGLTTLLSNTEPLVALLAPAPVLKHCQTAMTLENMMDLVVTIAGKSIFPSISIFDLTSPIVGTRYHCLKCKDFDLCQKCEGQGIHCCPMVILPECPKRDMLSQAGSHEAPTTESSVNTTSSDPKEMETLSRSQLIFPTVEQLSQPQKAPESSNDIAGKSNIVTNTDSETLSDMSSHDAEDFEMLELGSDDESA